MHVTIKAGLIPNVVEIHGLEGDVLRHSSDEQRRARAQVLLSARVDDPPRRATVDAHREVLLAGQQLGHVPLAVAHHFVAFGQSNVSLGSRNQSTGNQISARRCNQNRLT